MRNLLLSNSWQARKRVCTDIRHRTNRYIYRTLTERWMKISNREKNIHITHWTLIGREKVCHYIWGDDEKFEKYISCQAEIHRFRAKVLLRLDEFSVRSHCSVVWRSSLAMSTFDDRAPRIGLMALNNDNVIIIITQNAYEEKTNRYDDRWADCAMCSVHIRRQMHIRLERWT